LLIPPSLVFLLPLKPPLLTPFLGVVQLELTPESIAGVTYALEAVNNFPFPAIRIGHALPVGLVFSALTAPSDYVLANLAGIGLVCRSDAHDSPLSNKRLKIESIRSSP
jgi:hypothetical protein